VRLGVPRHIPGVPSLIVRRLLWLLVLVAAIVACSNSDDTPNDAAAETVDSTVAPAAGSTAAASADSTADITTAADQFLALVAPVNCANDALRKANADASPNGDLDPEQWETLLPPLDALAKAERQFAVELRQHDWPDTISGDIDELATAATASSLQLAAAAKSTSIDDLGRALTSEELTSTANDAAVIADTVRQKLKLPAADSSPAASC
jgi:hypothetical protein